MSKYPEAISYFKKALVLDPENDTYKSNLKIAEQKQREVASQVGWFNSLKFSKDNSDTILKNICFFDMSVWALFINIGCYAVWHFEDHYEP